MAELVFASYAIFLLTGKINNLTTERQLLLGGKKMLHYGIRKMAITDCGAPLPITADKDL